MKNLKRAIGRVALWVISGLAGLIMVMLGASKIAGNPPWPEYFAQYGYPGWFLIAVGLAQVAGGILIVIPRVARFGAGLLTVVMAGATVTELTRPGGFPSFVPALVYTLIFAGILVVRVLGVRQEPT